MSSCWQEGSSFGDPLFKVDVIDSGFQVSLVLVYRCKGIGFLCNGPALSRSSPDSSGSERAIPCCWFSLCSLEIVMYPLSFQQNESIGVLIHFHLVSNSWFYWKAFWGIHSLLYFTHVVARVSRKKPKNLEPLQIP